MRTRTVAVTLLIGGAVGLLVVWERGTAGRLQRAIDRARASGRLAPPLPFDDSEAAAAWRDVLGRANPRTGRGRGRRRGAR